MTYAQHVHAALAMDTLNIQMAIVEVEGNDAPKDTIEYLRSMSSHHIPVTRTHTAHKWTLNEMVHLHSRLTYYVG